MGAVHPERQPSAPSSRALAARLGSHRVSRAIYGTVVGLALVVALEAHPPSPGSVAGLLASTAFAVAMAELYSELLAARFAVQGPVDPERRSRAVIDALSVAAGAGFPAVYFVLAAAGVMEGPTAFALAKWTGLALIGVYGFLAAWLAGAGVTRSVLYAIVVVVVGTLVVLVKSLVH
jgi:hypothetical protein